MSAAEKLRALEKHMRRHKTEMLYPESARLRDALPQIVAVVEAIETALDQDHGDGIPTMAIGVALAALEEALAA